MSEELIRLEKIKKAVMNVIKSQKRIDRLLEKSSNMDWQNSTQKQLQKNSADITWANMDHDMLVHELHCTVVEANIAAPQEYRYGKKDYHPSCLHHYKKVFRTPSNFKGKE